MDTLDFISRYEAILRDKKIPKMKFYKDCEISDAAVSQWRKKKTKPAMTTISRIAEYLNVSVGHLMGTEQNEKSPAPEGAERIPGFSDLSEENKAKALEYIALLLGSQQSE